MEREKRDRDARDVLVAHLICLTLGVVLVALGFGWLAYQWPALSWLVGLFFAVLIGGTVCRIFLRVLRIDYMRNPKPKSIGPTRGVPPWLLGAFEGFVFTVAIGASFANERDPQGIFVVMGVWLGAKMLTGWNRDITPVLEGKTSREREQRFEERSRGAFTALLAGALNMVMAVIGGNIAGGETVNSLAFSIYQFLWRAP